MAAATMTATVQKPLNILLLGGTSEATLLAKRLADSRGIAATLSLAGRTANAAPSALPVRIGGFGGAEGLADYLAREAVDIVIDATHPFAAQISDNAIRACADARVPLLAIERPSWAKTTGDDWDEHPTVDAAIAALPEAPIRVFSALGRSAIPALCAQPQHHYVIRIIDPVVPPPALVHATIVTARGPFRTDDDKALFRQHGIVCVLAKNSGGDAAYAKIEAARALGLKVHMVRRPEIAKRRVVTSVDDAMAWIADHLLSRADRGV
jgi:precorrin-6A/cobalt-precorrin-6A reductase